MKRPRVRPLNLSATGFHSTSKTATQSYSQGIDQLKAVSKRSMAENVALKNKTLLATNRRRLAKPRAFVAFGKVVFLSLAKWSYFFLLWVGFFRFLTFVTQGLFSAFEFSIRGSVRSFHV